MPGNVFWLRTRASRGLFSNRHARSDRGLRRRVGPIIPPIGASIFQMAQATDPPQPNCWLARRRTVSEGDGIRLRRVRHRRSATARLRQDRRLQIGFPSAIKSGPRYRDVQFRPSASDDAWRTEEVLCESSASRLFPVTPMTNSGQGHRLP